MKYQFLLLLCLFFGFKSFSQQIQIRNIYTNEPISDVAVYNQDKTKSTISDFDGYVNLNQFADTDLLTFQHTSYKRITLQKKQAVTGRNIVILEWESGKLDEIVFSVNRFDQEKKDIPQKILGINAGEIQFSNPQTSADLLSNNGKIFVQKSQMGGGSPMIRGFSANRLLMTVDGIRMNTAIFRGGNIQNVIAIDPFIVDHTEVILGPGSVVYGSDAIGGVINFYTLQPAFSFEEGVSFSGNATTRYATASNEKTVHTDINFGLKEWAFLSSITYNDFGDLRMGKHGPDHYLRPYFIESSNGEDIQIANDNPLMQLSTGYSQISLAQKIRFLPNERWSFAANLLFSETSDVPRYDRLTRERNGMLRDAEWYYGPQMWFSGNIQAENTVRNKFYDKTKIIAAYQRFEESRNNRNRNSPSLFSTEEQVDAYSVNVDFTKKLEDFDIFYGVESIYNNVHSRGNVTNIETGDTAPSGSRYPDGSSWQSYAVYTSVLWHLTNNLSIQSGLRYNQVFIEADFNDPFYDFPFRNANVQTGNLTGNAGISYQANETLGLRANFGTAFRAPNIDDIGKVFESEPGNVVVPNPFLKAEYAYSAEVGTTFNFDNIVKIDLSIFYTKLENALVRRDFNINGETEILYQGKLSNVQAIQNASDARSYGFEAGIVLHLSNTLQFLSNYTITQGYEVMDNGAKEPLRHAPPHFGSMRLTWKKDRINLQAYTNYSGRFNPNDLAPSEIAKPEIYPQNAAGQLYYPGWYTLNFTAQMQVTDQWLATASLENISDQRYRTYSSGIAASGRNLILALKYSF